MSIIDLIIADGQWERATCRLREVTERGSVRLFNNARVWRAEEPISGEDGLYVWLYRDPRKVWQVTAGPAMEPGEPWPDNVLEGKGFMAGSCKKAETPTDPRNLPWEEYNSSRGRFEPFPAGLVACLPVEGGSAPPTPRRSASFDSATFGALGGVLLRSASSLVGEVEPSLVAAARDATSPGMTDLPTFEQTATRPPASFSSYRVIRELIPACEVFAADQLGLPLAHRKGGGAGGGSGGHATVLSWRPALPATSELGDLTQLVALPTDGDGNCLLHALSLGMWGLHAARPSSRPGTAGSSAPQQPPEPQEEPLRALLDRMLRNAEFASSTEPKWHAEQRRQNEALGEASISEGAELQRAMSDEWHRAVNEAARPGVFLGKLHIYALSQVLKRPIVVFQDPGASAAAQGAGVGSNGGGGEGKSGQGGDFGDELAGVYLPTLWGDYGQQHLCSREPLMVLFNGHNHFTALVFPEGSVSDAALAASASCADAAVSGEAHRVAAAISNGSSSRAPTPRAPPLGVCRCVSLHRTDGTPLPVRFTNPGDENMRDELLRQYLDVVEPWGQLKPPVFCAVSSEAYILPESAALRDAHRTALKTKDLGQSQLPTGLVEEGSLLEEVEMQKAIYRSALESRPLEEI